MSGALILISALGAVMVEVVLDIAVVRGRGRAIARDANTEAVISGLGVSGSSRSSEEE
jgi:hypothetical protein